MRLFTALFFAVLILCGPVPATAFDPSNEEVRSATLRVCVAFAERNVTTFLTLASSVWNDSTKATWRGRLENGDYATIPVRSCEIRDVSVDAERAKVRLVFDRVDGKTGQAAKGFRMNHFFFYLRRESGEWKILEVTGVEEELIGNLIAARSLEEKTALIKAEPELNNHRALFTAIYRLQTEGRYDMTEDFFKLADWYNDEFFKGRNESSLVNTNVNVLNARASNALAVGDTSTALKFYIEAAGIAEEYQKRTGNVIGGSILIQLNVGVMYLKQGNIEQAEKFVRDVLKSLENADRLRQEVLIKSAHETLGDIQVQKGEYDAALENYKIAGGEIRHGIGAILLKKGDLKTGAEIFERTLEMRRSAADRNLKFHLPTAVEAAVMMSEIRRKEARNADSLAFARSSVEFANLSKNPELILSAKTTEGNALLALGKNAEAEAAFNEAVRVVEEGRNRVVGTADQRAGYLANRVEAYHRLIDIHAARGEDWKVLDVAERSKARVLSEILNSEKTNLSEVLEGTEAEGERKLREKINQTNRELVVLKNLSTADKSGIPALTAEAEKLRLDYEFLETAAANKNDRFRRAKGVLDRIDQSQTNALLTGNQHAVIEYAVTGENAYAVVIRRATGNVPQIKVFKLPISLDQISKSTKSFRIAISTANLNYRDEARRLYSALIEPFAADLAGVKSLTVIPDGELWQVPFAALVGPTGRFVIEDRELSYAHSLTALRELNKLKVGKPAQNGDLFAIGNPIVEESLAKTVRSKYRSELGELPEAETEVNAIRKIYGPQSLTFTRSAASENAWRANSKGYRVLHLATHGVVNPIKPLHSYLYLAPSPDGVADDGILEAREIMRERLSADLAVLSACDTASGKTLSGEGMMGLSWAFAVAGVPRVVSSQWKVESKATADLMVDFHKALKSGKQLAPATALRSAMLTQMRRPARNHPFYWAPFISIGG